MLACSKFDLTGELKKINAPVLVICGTEDKMTPPASSEQIAAGIAGAKLVLIEGAGHMVMMEKPAAFNDALRDFAAALPQAVAHKKIIKDVDFMLTIGTSNFIIALAKVIDIILTVYMWIIVARALISWVNPDPYNKIVIFLYRVTEPVLRPIRKIIPRHSLPIDFAPLIVLLIIIFLQYFLVQTMIQMASGL